MATFKYCYSRLKYLHIDLSVELTNTSVLTFLSQSGFQELFCIYISALRGYFMNKHPLSNKSQHLYHSSYIDYISCHLILYYFYYFYDFIERD